MHYLRARLNANFYYAAVKISKYHLYACDSKPIARWQLLKKYLNANKRRPGQGAGCGLPGHSPRLNTVPSIFCDNALD